jgi:hypothetical protein
MQIRSADAQLDGCLADIAVSLSAISMEVRMFFSSSNTSTVGLPGERVIDYTRVNRGCPASAA